MQPNLDQDDPSPVGLWRSALVRRGVVCTIVMLLLLPAMISSSGRSIESMENSPLRWIPRESESRQDFNQFLDLFGAHEIVLVSWSGCRIDDPRLDEIEKALGERSRRRREAAKPRVINQVMTGLASLRQLTEPPINLSQDDALERLQGVVVGEDGETSCVVIELTDYGAEHRSDTIDLIVDVVKQATGLQHEDLILAGPTVNAQAIDEESQRSIRAYSIPSVIISLALCWVCLRSLWLSILVLVVGIYGQGLMLSLVYWTGKDMNAILIVLPTLVFVLSVSAGVHLVHYFLEELREGDPGKAASRAVAKARGPCLLAAITTAIGLASLGVSTVYPVRDFGILGAVGIMVCVGLLFLIVPAFMVIALRIPRISQRWVEHAAVPAGSSPVFAAVSRWVWRHSAVIRLVGVTTMICIGSGLIWLQTSIDLVALLSEDNPAVQDVHWFEEHIGQMVPLEVIVHFEQDCPLTPFERLGVVTLLQQEVSRTDHLDGVVSVATFLPPYPRSKSLRSTAVRSVIRKRLDRNRGDFVDAKYLADTPGGEAWRISARISGTEPVDHGRFLSELNDKIGTVVEKLREGGYTGISTTCTGVEAVSQAVQESLLKDLFNSFLLALLLVAIVMMFALRSISCGLLAMLPNVFPTLLLFGGMGWIGKTVDIGTVMTASVALGIAVDGTFHFLKWFTQSVARGLACQQAISIAFTHCGRALVQTTIICASGLLIYSFSGFIPVRHFSVMMVLLLTAALVGDLILLPALLAGSLGAALSRKYQPAEDPVDVATIPTS
jgi:predicted RND superfamily exporter protein